MNLLAHQHLSFDREYLMVGNFIADAIKGNDFTSFSPPVKAGILLHRAIDTFTDTHPLVLESRKLLYPYFHKYAAVVQDVYYDHFLASLWPIYSKLSLSDFVNRVYDILQKNFDILPVQMQRMATYMINQNWLLSYKTTEGAAIALKRMAKRTSFPSNMEHAHKPLLNHYQPINQHFIEFYPKLYNFVYEKFSHDINQLPSIAYH